MAKRELIDSEKLLEDFQVGIPILQAIKNNTITEEEIVKPYLEKLKKQILEQRKVEHIPEDVKKWDYIKGMDRVVTLIENLLTEKGAEE